MPQEKTVQRLKQLKVEISEDLHRDLKVLLASQQRTFRQWLREHVQSDIAKHSEALDALRP